MPRRVAAAKLHRPGAVGRPELRARVLPDLARHLPHAFRSRRRSTRCRSTAGRSSAPTAWSSAPCASGTAQLRRPGDAARGRPAARRRSRRSTAAARSATRGSSRTPIADEIHHGPARAARRRADQAGVHVGPRRRTASPGRPTRATSRTSTWRTTTAQPDADHRHQVARHHAGLVARRAGDRLHVVPHRLPRHHRRRHLRQADARRRPPKGTSEKHNFLPAWSPDGTKLAFMSNRDGNPEIYVVNRDGSGLRRLTNHPENDVTPTWSPTGNQIAFTSDRTGRPQIWIMNADGSGQQQHHAARSWCDRPTWSPAPFNEIAYTSQAGGGYDIRIFDFATRSVRSITNGEGSNESPAFSPNGRHIAFSSVAGRQVADLHHRSRRSEPASAHADRRQPFPELVQLNSIVESTLIGMQMRRTAASPWRILSMFAMTGAACAKKKPPVARPTTAAARRRVHARTVRPSRRARSRSRSRSRPSRATADELASRDLDDINKNSPFQPLFFGYDQSEVVGEGQQVLNANAEIMKRYPTWIMTIEGHADERGTAEYNLALGERRALAARNYLVSLGISGRPAAHRELRQGVPVRPGTDRRGLLEEPARPLRGHQQVDMRQCRRLNAKRRRIRHWTRHSAFGVCDERESRSSDRGLSAARAAVARGADKTHQQMMAEIRMLQEQQAQLQQLLARAVRHAQGDDARRSTSRPAPRERRSPTRSSSSTTSPKASGSCARRPTTPTCGSRR